MIQSESDRGGNYCWVPHVAGYLFSYALQTRFSQCFSGKPQKWSGQSVLSFTHFQNFQKLLFFFIFYITPTCLFKTQNRHFSTTNYSVPVSIFKFASSLLHFIFFILWKKNKWAYIVSARTNLVGRLQEPSFHVHLLKCLS